jgi:hypothetical protein
MEGLAGFEHKYQWSIVGHSGDGAAIPLVSYENPPRTQADRLKILMTMQAHSQYCSSGYVRACVTWFLFSQFPNLIVFDLLTETTRLRRRVQLSNR